MINKNFFIMIISLLSVFSLSQAMENNIENNENSVPAVKLIVKNHESAFFPLANELIEHIASFVVDERSQSTQTGNLNQAAKNLKRFAWVIWQDRGFNILDFSAEGSIERNINCFLRYFKVNPFFIRNRLYMKLPEALKEKYLEQALDQEIEKCSELGITRESLAQWVAQWVGQWIEENKGYDSDNDRCRELKYESIDDDLYKKFIHAARKKIFINDRGRGHIETILAYVVLGGDPDKKLNNFEGALYFATFKSNVTISILLNLGANSNINRVLYDALNMSDKVLVQLLLYAGANPDKYCEETPLMQCADFVPQTAIEIAELLLNAGASINLKTEKGTALSKAISNFNIPFVKYLLEKGASSDINISDKLGGKPIIETLEEIVSLLKTHSTKSS